MSKIPDKFRITFRPQHDGGVDENVHRIKIPLPHLGFQTAHDPHKKDYAKRKKTQDEWAYGDRYHDRPDNPSFFELDGKMWQSRGQWVHDGTQHNFILTKTQVAEELQPIIVDNVPMEGFRIQHSVSRYDTSNKLWRILDPRGYELEITTGTMENLVMGGQIDKGLIIGACVWRTAKILERV